jgi:hypothetical protein
MTLLGSYINGNYAVEIYSDGTKVRETLVSEDDKFIADFPECMDVKITNYCDMNCAYCHEDSTAKGRHGDILNPKFIDTLRPYTEIAIGGGNPLSHPDLIEFLHKLKDRNIIANMTINQAHFENSSNTVDYLIANDLIKGLGISLVRVGENTVSMLKKYDNAVLHVINGVVKLSELEKLYGCGFKVLILGYKQFRKGIEFYSSSIEDNKLKIYNSLPEIIRGFKVVSFDNLAIDQLDVRRLLSQAEWDEFYMGDDGQHTMYIDLVEQKYARCSVSNVRYDLEDDIVDMFNVVKNEQR